MMTNNNYNYTEDKEKIRHLRMWYTYSVFIYKMAYRFFKEIEVSQFSFIHTVFLSSDINLDNYMPSSYRDLYEKVENTYFKLKERIGISDYKSDGWTLEIVALFTNIYKLKGEMSIDERLNRAEILLRNIDGYCFGVEDEFERITKLYFK